MRILLIGSNGGIAKRLTISLRDSFNQVHIAGLDVSGENDHLDEYKQVDLLKVVNSEPEIEVLRDIISNSDYVMILAAAVHQHQYSEASVSILNVEMPNIVFGICKEVLGQKGHVVFFSSISVYGNQPQHIVDEDTVLNPESLYAASKAEAEKRLINQSEQRGSPILTILRLATVISSIDRGNLKKLVDTISRYRIGITVRKGIKKSFVDIEDVVKIILKIVENPPEATGIYNISADAIDVNHIMKQVCSISNTIFSIPMLRLVLKKIAPALCTSISINASKAKKYFQVEFNSFDEAFFREFSTDKMNKP